MNVFLFFIIFFIFWLGLLPTTITIKNAYTLARHFALVHDSSWLLTHFLSMTKSNKLHWLTIDWCVFVNATDCLTRSLSGAFYHSIQNEVPFFCHSFDTQACSSTRTHLFPHWRTHKTDHSEIRAILFCFAFSGKWCFRIENGMAYEKRLNCLGLFYTAYTLFL